MKRYEVLISDNANADMEAIYKYISETLLAPVTAAKQYNRIADAILTLEEMPERIRVMDSEAERKKGLRPLVVDNYIVFFVIKANTVNVVRVLYSASDISKRLTDKRNPYPG
jgi:plasmid stabilization system protein ParE